jgi:hypothetical protein
MKFEDAVQKSVKLFLDGKTPPKTTDLAEQGRLFTPDYFDALEERILGATEKDKI